MYKRQTVHCAAELLKLTPEYDYLIAPEAKAIPLVYEMARQSGADKYFVARKKAKAYMSSVFQVHVKSITTQGVQTLVLDQTDAELIHGKRIVIVDDVISTGESLRAMEELVKKAGVFTPAFVFYFGSLFLSRASRNSLRGRPPA